MHPNSNFNSHISPILSSTKNVFIPSPMAMLIHTMKLTTLQKAAQKKKKKKRRKLKITMVISSLWLVVWMKAACATTRTIQKFGHVSAT
jgi:hypothetical protein